MFRPVMFVVHATWSASLTSPVGFARGVRARVAADDAALDARGARARVAADDAAVDVRGVLARAAAEEAVADVPGEELEHVGRRAALGGRALWRQRGRERDARRDGLASLVTNAIIGW